MYYCRLLRAYFLETESGQDEDNDDEENEVCEFVDGARKVF